MTIEDIPFQVVSLADSDYNRDHTIEEELTIPIRDEDSIFRCKLVQLHDHSVVVITGEHFALDGKNKITVQGILLEILAKQYVYIVYYSVAIEPPIQIPNRISFLF
jgi:hypothetical protein